MSQKISTNRGKKKTPLVLLDMLDECLKPGQFEYAFVACLLRKLPGQFRYIAAEKILAATQPLAFFENPLNVRLVDKALEITRMRRPRPLFPGHKNVQLISPFVCDGPVHATGVLAGIYNSGKHLYWSRTWPNEYKTTLNMGFLPYRHFRGCGVKIDCGRLQHLGHLHGIHGGPADIVISAAGKSWRIKCQPNVFYYLIDFGFDQALFAEPRVFPREILSHGH